MLLIGPVMRIVVQGDNFSENVAIFLVVPVTAYGDQFSYLGLDVHSVDGGFHRPPGRILDYAFDDSNHIASHFEPGVLTMWLSLFYLVIDRLKGAIQKADDGMIGVGLL